MSATRRRSRDGFAETLKVLGQVDKLVANAGCLGPRPGAILQMTSDEWRRVLRVNLDGAFFTFRTAARHMAERGKGGSLVAMSARRRSRARRAASHYGVQQVAASAPCRCVALSVELAR